MRISWPLVLGRISDLLKFLLTYFTFSWKKELHVVAGDAERVAWHEVKSAVIYRLDHRAETASDRGVLTQKKVVACPPGTEVLEFGAAVQQQALWCGMARAQEVFVVVDGAAWLWSLIEDRFSGTTQTLDFYHASQRLWELAHYLYANDAEAARVFVEPLLHQLRHGESSRRHHAPRRNTPKDISSR